MLKKIFVVVAVVFAAYSVNAQAAFEKGDKALNIGIGLGDSYGEDFTIIPAVNGSFEVGIIDIPNVGVIGVGGFAGFKFAPYSYYNYTHTALAGRAAFHFQFFDTGNFDLYAGLSTGYEFWAYSDYYANGSDILFEEFVGARWMKKDNFGFFAELGYGVSSIKAGITMKF